MKYLFINSTAGVGSTGKIAADTCRKLIAEGNECRIAYGRFEVGCPDIETYRICNSMETKLNGLLCRVLDNHGFGLRSSTKKFIEWIKIYNPDVIWLHNVHGYYLHAGLLFSYLKTCGKKICWTLHDCWAFTGHCAYFDYARCEKWKTGCHDCTEKRQYPSSFLMDRSSQNYQLKKELFTGIPDLKLIVPSRWMCELVKQSFLREYPVEICYNRIDTTVFRPLDSDFRRQYHLESRKILLGVASVWDRRKGLEDFRKLAELIDDNYRIVLVGLRPDQMKDLPPRILGFSRTRNAEELAKIYTAADLLLNPTYEDNYPTVNLEALACGLPVITYRTGGSPESLDETCGMVTDRNPDAMWQAVQKAHFKREDCLRRSRVLNGLQV